MHICNLFLMGASGFLNHPIFLMFFISLVGCEVYLQNRTQTTFLKAYLKSNLSYELLVTTMLASFVAQVPKLEQFQDGNNSDIQDNKADCCALFDTWSDFDIHDQSYFISFWEQSDIDIYVQSYFVSFRGQNDFVIYDVLSLRQRSFYKNLSCCMG